MIELTEKELEKAWGLVKKHLGENDDEKLITFIRENIPYKLNGYTPYAKVGNFVLENTFATSEEEKRREVRYIKDKSDDEIKKTPVLYTWFGYRILLTQSIAWKLGITP